MWILIIIVGAILISYLNIKFAFKINFTFTSIYVYFNLIIFKKRYKYENRFNFLMTQKIIDKYRNPEGMHKIRKYLKYYKHTKKLFKLFYVKNIQVYPETIMGKQTFAIQFVVVNSILKKSLLNG